MNQDYQTNLELYEALVATNPEVDRKGKTMLYTSRNGHMFSFLDKQGVMALRLPKEARETFLVEFQSSLSEQYGAIMKEYVNIPQKLLESTSDLKPDLMWAMTISVASTKTNNQKEKNLACESEVDRGIAKKPGICPVGVANALFMLQIHTPNKFGSPF